MSADPSPAEVTPLGNGRYRITQAGVSRLGYALVHGDRTWTFVDGRVAVLARGGERTARRPGEHDDESSLVSSMPATVVAIVVTTGQHVKAGDVLVRLEAMKMELPIKAPRDGMVTSIACREGELVQPGVRLVTLE